MVHVNSFLGCAKLETGGKIVAFLQMITYAVVLILLLAVICLGTATSDQDEKPILNDDQIVAEAKPKLSPIVWIIIAIFIAASCIAIIVLAVRSLNAIKTRNHVLMFEMMALMFAVTCFYMYVFLIQLWLWPIQCVVTIFVIVYNFYLYIVVYSLYRIFRKEHEQEVIRQQKANIETNV